MKRLFLLSVLVVLAFAGTGCNNSPTGNGTQNNGPRSSCGDCIVDYAGGVVLSGGGSVLRPGNVFEELYDQISFNLSKMGEIEPVQLNGVWDCVRFAYTADGNTISEVAAISKGELTIPAFFTDKIEDTWRLSYVNDIWYTYSFSSSSLSDNLLTLNLAGSTIVGAPPEEDEIDMALENAYSFVIKGNELMIYFIGVENKNLLILEKRVDGTGIADRDRTVR